MSKETGGPAFPVSDIQSACPATVDEMNRLARGMTLRDYFAAKALPSVIDTFAFGNSDPTDYAEGIAEGCYEIADAMLKARAA